MSSKFEHRNMSQSVTSSMYRRRFSAIDNSIVRFLLIVFSFIIEPFLSFSSYYKIQKLLNFPVVRARAIKKLGYNLNLENPTTFNEKITHRKLFSRDSEWVKVSDKIAVENWLRHRDVASHIRFIPHLQIFSDAEQIDMSLFPQHFVVKAAWASGYNLFIDKENFDLENLKSTLRKWKHERYRFNQLIWPAQHIPRRFVVQPILLDEKNKFPNDYKFFVFHGKVKFFQVDFDRSSGHRRNFYNRDGSLLPVQHRVPNLPNEKNSFVVPEMIKFAEDVGKFFTFIRVDIYKVKNSILFGELTMTPADGCGDFYPKKYDKIFGDCWSYDPRRAV